MKVIRYAVWSIIMFASIASRGETTYEIQRAPALPSGFNTSAEYVTVREVPSGGSSANTDSSSSGGCYVATVVYGSYDCPQVWTLRRYRDDTLASTLAGRCFIHTYYAISPTLVRLFGHNDWFVNTSKGILDKFVQQLNEEGVSDLPYADKQW